MKKHLFLLISVVWVASAVLAADESPEDQFFKAASYALDAEAARSESDWAGAHTKFAAAQAILNRLRREHPDWNAQVVEYRIRTYRKEMESLQPFLNAEAAAGAGGANQEEVQKLTKQLEAAEDRLGQVELLRQELATRLQTQQQNADSLAKEKSALQAKLDAAVKRIDEFAKHAITVEEISAELASSQDELRALKAKRVADEEKSDETAALKSRVAELTTANDELTTEIEPLRQEAQQTAALKTSLAETRAQLEALQSQIEHSNTEIARLTKSADDSKRKLAEIRETTAKRESVLEQRSTAALNSARAELQKAEQRAAKADELTKQNKQLRAQLDKVGDDRTEHERIVGEFKLASSKIDDLEAALAAARAENEKRVQADEAAKKSSEELAAARDELNKFQDVAAQLDAAQQEKLKLERDLAKLQAVSQQFETLTQEKARLELELVRASKNDELQRVRGDLATLTQQNAALKGELTAAQVKAEALRVRAANLEIADLRNTFMELGAQLGKSP